MIMLCMPRGIAWRIIKSCALLRCERKRESYKCVCLEGTILKNTFELINRLAYYGAHALTLAPSIRIVDLCYSIDETGCNR